MKKVSILSLHLNYGGAEKSICALANLLCDKYSVEIACTYKINDEPAFFLDPKIKIKYLTNVVPNKDKIKKCIKSKNIIKLIKELFYSIKVLYLKKYTMKMYIKNSSSDIIISSRYTFNNLLSKYGKKETLKIGWEHNHPHGNLKFEKKVIKSTKNLDYLVVVSKNLQKLYKDKIKNTKCVYIPNIVDRTNKISNLDNKRLISVGRLSKEKGFMDLLKIYKKISEKYPDWILDIVGDGDEKDTLKKYINDNNLNKKVILHGFKSKEYINDLLKNSSIYLMTSFTESFGIVLIEAMSFGIPCVAFSSAEGARELIKNDKNGYLIENRDAKKYEEKVEYLMDNFFVRDKMKSKCIKSANRFNKENVSKMWFDIL